MIYQRLKMKMFLEYIGFFLKKILYNLNYLTFDENNKMNKSLVFLNFLYNLLKY